MQVLSFSTLRAFWQIHPKAQAPLTVWHARVKAAQWNGPQDVKSDFGALVDFVADERVIFDVGGNNYRIVARMSYPFKRVMIKFVGTHKEYDKINPETV